MSYIWNHNWITGDSNGIATQSSGNSSGTHPSSVGGYIGGDACNTSNNNTETDGTGLNNSYPVIGTWWVHDSGTNTDYGVVAFAVPPGVTVRAHVWCVV